MCQARLTLSRVDSQGREEEVVASIDVPRLEPGERREFDTHYQADKEEEGSIYRLGLIDAQHGPC